jgi:hypothetical protein
LYLEEVDPRDEKLETREDKLTKASNVGILVPILEAYDGMGNF